MNGTRTSPRLEPPSARPAIPKVSLREVTKTYRDSRGMAVEALGGVSFDVHPGEFVCLIGPSGSGKTTILNLIAGLDRPTSGRVLLDDRPVPDPGPDRALLFQEPALFPWLSVAQNVEFPLRMAGAAAAERRDRALTWLSRVHMARWADAQPHELSAGMRQRVALARALACEPDVLLADEPFGALDAQAREVLQNELQNVCADTGSTVVFVTHNVREAVFLADRVLVMSAPPGSLVEEQRIHSARPRRMEDTLLQKVASDIHERLRLEVDKVVAREIGG
jgi:NitT/TauT family transport system ATP-binding protein